MSICEFTNYEREVTKKCGATVAGLCVDGCSILYTLESSLSSRRRGEHLHLADWKTDHSASTDCPNPIAALLVRRPHLGCLSVANLKS